MLPRRMYCREVTNTGHSIMVIASLLVTCAIFVGATTGILEDETKNLQPCPFNLLCRCSRGGPEVGLIYCEDIPLANVPVGINNTKAFALNLRRNGLRRVEENAFHRTGLWRIDIRNNHLYSVPEMAFAGLERSLGELYLPFNRLQRVPQKALQNLEKLKVLDLGANLIVEVNREDFSGVEDSLQHLSLADNYLVTLQLESFTGFQRLERLDLRGNSILTVAPLGSSGTLKLSHLNLADNALEHIPFISLAQMRSLNTINLANNRISTTFDVFFQGRISIDTLILDNNMIGNLPPFAFQNFNLINKTSLNGNLIREIAEDAFKDAKIRDLSLSDCSVHGVDARSFRGLESSLQRLDLSYNNLSTLPENLLDKFDFLKALILNDNPLTFKAEEVLSGFRYTLQTINLVGEKMGQIPVKQMNDIRNLRSLGLSSLNDRVSIGDFEGFGAALEHLSLSKNKLKTISSNSFRHVPGLKVLDLSENRISQIEADAFADVGTSLTHLHLTNGIGVGTLSSDPFKKLIALQSIDLSNNRITNLPDDFFHSMKEIRSINLQDNSIEKVPQQMFDNEHTPNLVNISLNFNFINAIEAQTFSDLPHLKILNLEDNKINRIAKGAFQNIESLEYISLEGNMINTIEAEAFHNLPKLETLNLGHNNLEKLSFDWLDQVGTLSAIKLDVSHNLIQQLSSNRTGWSSYSSIRSLDLGYNNISFISRNYFEPIRSSLTHLVLQHNQLRNISRDVYSDMQHLLWLDISDNNIQLVDSDAFANAKSLQVLLLDHNDISEIYQDMLSRSSTLRVINISHNRLRFLPDTLFKDTQLEILDVSHNQISKIPDGCLSRIATTLRHLDASHNEITSITPDQLKKLTDLVYLDLSNNAISTLSEKTFSSLNRLSYLDLSSNPIQTVADHIFDNLLQSLVHLNLADIGSINLGDFHLPELLSLNISYNTVENLPSDFFTRYANLKDFDISYCQLTVLPESPWSTASKLRSLNLSGNNLTVMANGTLASMKSLEYLNIKNLPLHTFEEGSLFQMTNLRHLAIGTYERVKGMDIPKLLDFNHAIKHLEIDVEAGTFENQLRGKLPFKLGNITISGNKLKTIGGNALKDIQGKSLTLTLRDNSVTELSRALFQNLGNVRWLQLDIRHNKLSSVAEPSTTIHPGTSGSVFLTQLHMADNPWSCDCSVGWVEFWMRKWRQSMCKDRCSSYQTIIRDLRAASCRNKGEKPFITVLKNDLECGWSSSSTVTSSWFQWTLVVAFGMAFVQQLKSF
ncbi:chaoptin-like [Daphnia pulex]|uniref:chaoptin-like n=1 Tax=Daphnia pulex TaxID=6669 RepID=UPI001EDCDCC7|nr:chaoptin-like [Daphnia pulex]